MGGYRVGLALGGGAARGWSHIGVIEALLEAGITPGVIAGTSMGALVGGAYAAGRLDALKAWALSVDWRTIAGLLDVNLGTGGLVEGGRIRQFLLDLGLTGRIEEAAIPFAAVATHLVDGREIWLQSGPLADAIRASIAIPGIISPCRLDGRWLVDGGLVNQIPVSTCRALGADCVIAVNVGDGLLEKHSAALRQPVDQEPRHWLAEMIARMPPQMQSQARRLLPQPAAEEPLTPGYFAVLATSLSIMQEKIMRSRLAGEPPHAMISPRVAGIRLMDFDRAAEAIEAGRAATEAMLPAIRAELAR